MQLRSVLINEGSWLLTGALIAIGVTIGFFSFFGVPLVLLGLMASVLLAVQRRPGAWMLLTAASGLPTALYATDFLNGGTCPYSSLVMGGPSGPRCGPPDVLYIFLALAALMSASLALGLRSLLKRRAKSATRP